MNTSRPAGGCYDLCTITTLHMHSQRQHMMRREMEEANKQQEEQAKNKEIEQEREQIEKDKLNKQQLTQNGKTVFITL